MYNDDMGLILQKRNLFRVKFWHMSSSDALYSNVQLQRYTNNFQFDK